MISYVRRALAAALAGALAGAASLVVAFRLHPAVTMEMDRDAPRILSGFYDPEQYRILRAKGTVAVSSGMSSWVGSSSTIPSRAKPGGVAGNGNKRRTALLRSERALRMPP